MATKLSPGTQARVREQLRLLVIDALRWYGADEGILSAMSDAQLRRTILDYAAMVRWIPDYGELSNESEPPEGQETHP